MRENASITDEIQSNWKTNKGKGKHIQTDQDSKVTSGVSYSLSLMSLFISVLQLSVNRWRKAEEDSHNQENKMDVVFWLVVCFFVVFFFFFF